MKTANGEPIAVAQRWAYRKGLRDAVVCVEVTRLGTSRPPRVRVHFVDDDYEGREDWVPPSRLKVRWEDVAEWQKREDRWTAVRDASAGLHETHEDAAGWIFDTLRADWNYAHRLWGKNTGILVVTYVDGLVSDLGIERSTLVEDPSGFVDDDGSLVLPWRVTYTVARALADKYAERLHVEVDDWERKREHECQWRYMSGSGFISAEICAEVDAEHGRPVRDVLREWCGGEAQDRLNELKALRVEVKRLGKLIEHAIGALQRAGDRSAAKQLERDLGVPVEVLRQANRRLSAGQDRRDSTRAGTGARPQDWARRAATR